jgi:hypothetical protein
MKTIEEKIEGMSESASKASPILHWGNYSLRYVDPKFLKNIRSTHKKK